MIQPPLGWTTPVKVKKEGDGDTITVTIERTFVLRLVDDEIYFDTPEKGFRAKDDTERANAEIVTQFLHTLLFNSDGTQRNIVAHIPTSGDGDIKDSMTIGNRFQAH